MSSPNENNNCPICLEPIFQPAPDSSNSNNNFNIGATVPCGHLYHYDCFGSWQASRSYGTVKCPTCNVKTENFVRLYFDIGSLAGAQCRLVDDDDISLSSIEDDDKNDDDGENSDERGTTETPKEQDPPADSENENENVVDLTASPAPKNKSDDDDGNDQQQRDKLHRLARLAKKFKRQYLQKNLQYKEQYTEKRKISDRVRQVEGELLNVKEEMSELERGRGLTELRLNESRLSLVRQQREQEILRSQYSTMEQEKTRVDARLKECRLHYEKELENARAKSMSEVQEVLQEHPKVVEENRVLKQKLQKLNRDLFRGGTSNSSNNELFARRSKTNISKDINKALRQMDQQIRSRQTARPNQTARKAIGSESLHSDPQSRSRQTRRPLNVAKSARKAIGSTSSARNLGTASISVDSGQYSSLASRMMKASEKAKQPPRTSGDKKRSSVTSLSLLQNKRMKDHSATRRDRFQRKI